MTAPSIARAVAVLGAAILVVAACGQGGSTTTPGASSGATQGAAITQAPTLAPATQAAAPTEGAEPSFEMPSFETDEELEALLPSEIGGKDTEKSSATGEAVMGVGAGAQEYLTLLGRFDKQSSDLSVAFAGTDEVLVSAYRIKGVDADEFYEAFLDIFAAAQGATSTTVNHGGKTVNKVVPQDGDPVYIYPSGDVLYTVGATTAPLTDAQLNVVFATLG